MSGSPGPEVPDSLNISDDAPPPLLSAMQTDLSPVEGSSRYSSDSPPHLVKASTPEYTQSPLDLTSAETSVITTQTRPGNPHRGTEETTSPNRRHFEPPLSHATLSTISASALLPTFVTKRTLQPSPSRPSVASQRRKTLPGPSIRPKTPSAPRPSLDNSAKADYQQAMAAAAGMVPFFSLQPGGTMQMNFPQVAFAQQQMVAQQAAVSNAFNQAQDPNRPGPSMLPPNFLLAFQQQQQQNQHQFQLQQQQQQHQQRQQAQHQQQQLQQQHQQQLQQQQLQHQLQQQQNQQQFQIHFATIPQQSLSLGQPQQQPQFLIQQQLPQLVVQQLEAQQAPKSVQPKRQRAQKPQPERQQNNQSLNNIIGIAQTSQPNLILSPMNAPTSSTTSNAGVRLSTSVNPADQATPLLLRPQPKRPVHAGHANPALAAALATTSPVITTPQPSHAPTPASQQQFISIPVAQQLGTQEQLGFLQQVPSIVFTGATSAQLQQQYQQQTTPSVITTARPRAQIGGLRLPIQEEADDRPPVLERNVPQPIDLTSLPASSNGQPKRPPLLITNKFTGLTDAFAQEAAANRYRRELECAKRGEPIITRHFIGGMVIEESSKPFKFSDAEEDDSGSSESSEDDVIEVCDDGVVKQIESLNLNASA
uniref:BZIP domain-containing protein n=1 Tax=Steinernema glaseri TaxID=37863 RepID=A0A1I7Z479_9BILA